MFRMGDRKINSNFFTHINFKNFFMISKHLRTMYSLASAIEIVFHILSLST